MIFCTIGTTAFPFYRITDALEEALAGGNEKLILQAGQKNYRLSYQPVTIYKEISYKYMVYHLSRARAVVCHGGAGTILLALRYARVKPFVLPRLSRFKEHVDDHQMHFSKYMESKNLIILPSDSDHIAKDLRAYLRRPAFQKREVTDGLRTSLEARLTAYTQSQRT